MSQLKKAILQAVEGTPYDPHEDTTGGDPREMSDGELIIWAREIIDHMAGLYDEMGDDYQGSPMHSLELDLSDAAFEIAGVIM